MKLPPTFFFVPENVAGEPFPDCTADYWDWRVSLTKQRTFLGSFDWTLQTYLRLKDINFPCRLTRTPPDEGILIAHKDFLDSIPRPGPGVLLICLKADRIPHTYAQLHVVQNPEDCVEKAQKELGKSTFVPHWIQSFLIPRDPARQSRFENIGYIGSNLELAQEFQTERWKRELNARGFQWTMKTTSEQWHDYHDIDALVAVRKCNGKSYEFNHKPATKLYNAWHTEVPAILGTESAYQAERMSEWDYIEANTPEDVLHALIRLRDDPRFRNQMVQNGKLCAEKRTNEQILKDWGYFLTDVVPPIYGQWRRYSEWDRRVYFFLCRASKKMDKLKRGALKGLRLMRIVE
jgi:hypothetical protein